MLPSPPPPSGKKFYLFGYPVIRSAAPTFHNHLFRTWGTKIPNTYETWSTSRVTKEMLDIMARDDFGGAAVTMPIKSAVLSCLDVVSPESRDTGACNTVVKVPTPTGFKLVGQNTDILGVRNAVLHGLRAQCTWHITEESAYHAKANAAGLVIGGGATTRSAIFALGLLGVNPIFIVNRDADEVRGVRDAFPRLVESGSLIHLRHPGDVNEHLVGPEKRRIVVAVGAIPSTPPSTSEEEMVYTTVDSILSIPYYYTPEEMVSTAGQLQIPPRRIFLDMAYIPRVTPMLQMAAAHGWETIEGIQAMVEQGLAQQRMWCTSLPDISVGSDAQIIPREAALSVGDMAENIGSAAGIMVGAEIDRATSGENLNPV